MTPIACEHLNLSRRYFLRLGAAGACTLPSLPLFAYDDDAVGIEALAAAIAKLEYLTIPESFGTVERGDPLPYTHPPEKLREIGLVRETWKLEVVGDPAFPPKIESPLSREAGTALDWAALMKLAEQHAVRYLKVMTCNNGPSPLGMGLWEGVPLRNVIWLTKPKADVRRVFFHGYHNDDPKQLFQSSLPIGRVLEDPPGEYPVILCYKLNGEYLSGKRGGPVRMIVPDAYGFKSVKWLTRVVLTNAPAANDTYASGNNDIDSQMKTYARFVSRPAKVKAGEPVPVTGLAQVGISGLSRVQYWLHPQDVKWPADDPYFTQADWKDAELLSHPGVTGGVNWGGGLPDGRLPAGTLGFDTATGRSQGWPMRNTICHWAALLAPVAAGKYHLRCRTIDAGGIAQPFPRPFAKSGQNAIEQAPLTVEEG
jgi:DMSO/TMAO reductase YedYZ molybdopterin-dependent catalytic subunit